MHTKIYLTYILAWVSVLLGILLISKYFFRRAAASASGEKREKLSKINRALKTPHIVIAVLLVVTAFVHGFNSSKSVFSLNLGTLAFVIILFLGAVWIFKRLFKPGKWRIAHNILTVLLVLSVIFHVVDSGGIRVFKVLDTMQKVQQHEREQDQLNVGQQGNLPETDIDMLLA